MSEFIPAVVVTGASSGIGLATALLFAEKGYHVFLLGRNKDRLTSVHQQIATSGRGHSTLVPVDLAQPYEIETAAQVVIRSCAQKKLKLVALVNNAGIFQGNTTSDTDQNEAIWESQFNINMMSPVRLTHWLLPELKKDAPACIVNVSSTLGLRPTSNTQAYSAVKAALINWTQSLALELAPFQVRVNCISPGLVDTPIHSFRQKQTREQEKIKQEMDVLQPLARMGTVNDIAKAIFFLAGADSDWTTGSNLVVDGGINILN
jgi:NAD(P)-dependent dehydrogenase (short-subunit alcohol dehydrogenase family)